MRVLVTGAGGFIGRATVSAFLEQGHAVRALVRKVDDVHRPLPASVEVVCADLRTTDLDPATRGVDAVIHLAAGTRGSEAEQFASSVVGTERLLDAMTAAGVGRLVLVSSFSVYDWEAAGTVLTEQTPLTTDLERRGVYTAAKVWQERVVRRISAERGLALTVVRPGIVWGPGNEYPSGITAQFGPLHVVVGLPGRLPLTYVENCADALVVVAEAPAAVGETFNVVDGGGESPWRFVGEILARKGDGGRRLVVPYRAAYALVHGVRWVNENNFEGRARIPSVLDEPRFVARFKPLRYNAAKLLALGWRPTVCFEDALDRTYGARPAPKGRQ